ncbi:hypothetical protein [Gellertiella hungarica]|uniref:Uncharacterized protein n=1 Tax=Gellertiella hungarica TaxID=1572859 RepID=A0A7W6J540_9HYPH|nr:hypothetical protein [Gellertiella hungarica]MBB4064056.1 hypothetical protein [Gellertiella hungarica]
MTYEAPTKILAPDLGIGWQTGFELSVEMSPIAQSANIIRNWNGVAKNLAEEEFRLFAIKINSNADFRPPALANMWPGTVFSLVPPNEVCVIIPVGGTTAVFPRNVHEARALTMAFDDVGHTVSGKTVTLSAPAIVPVRVYARLEYTVMVTEPWSETYQEATADSQWQLSTEELGGLY